MRAPRTRARADAGMFYDMHFRVCMAGSGDLRAVRPALAPHALVRNDSRAVPRSTTRHAVEVFECIRQRLRRI